MFPLNSTAAASPSVQPTTPTLRTFRRVGVVGVILLLGLVVDQGTKLWALDQLQPHGVLRFGEDTVRLQLARNPGGFWGAGENLSVSARYGLFVVFNIGLLGSIAWFLCVPAMVPRMLRIGLGLLLIGGIGNLLDRLVHRGEVIDFLSMRLGAFQTGIFNFADVAITAGIAIVIAQAIVGVVQAHRSEFA
ncbi:lipoprotein signal peptidase [Roseimaritima multifibrata]|uniref:Lipoprotein signal peptidase n=1 Tax=Roseimaritima multifibrata TaxID=1930274 RepID=A0A517MKC8_9BACT|nr:signal peptidase II [Roseimaritima multifibrata]QDS95339.1 lipoprotein signal peptidase [Roseimaritima multifibrata]